MRSVIKLIQDDNPSYDPLTPALEEAGVSKNAWDSATNRIFVDGYYGPVSTEEYYEATDINLSVTAAIQIVANVLDKVEDYWEIQYCDEEETDTVCTGHRDWDSKVEADIIRAALVSPWWHEIYGTGYPRVGEFVR